MLCRIFLFLLLCGTIPNLFAQAPVFQIDWRRTLGGTDHETGFKVISTQDGGYAVISLTFSSDGHVVNNKGICDVWLIKLSANGTMQWQRTYGGSNDDGAYSIQQTTDGGYIIAGYTKSNDGDVTGFHGAIDAWIIRTAADGTMLWQKSMGGAASEVATSIKQTTDGGYIFAGYTLSKNGDVTAKRDNGDSQDYWLVKLSASGNKEWDRCFGSPAHDFALDVAELVNGGYAVSGYTQALGLDVTQHHGKRDVWVVKTNTNGTLLWQRSIGGSEQEQGTNIHATVDGGLVIAGHTSSTDKDIPANKGQTDGLLTKLDAAGNLKWVRCYGGTQLEAFRQVIPTADGGYLTIGSSESADNDVTRNYGMSDYWIVKTTANGLLEWQENFGGSNVDDGFSISKADVDSYLLSGVSFSNDNDVSNTIGGGDVWTLKINLRNPLPVIITQPADTLSVCVGSPVTFTLQANDAVIYQWQAFINNTWQNLTDGSLYSGTATNALLVIAATDLTPEKFRCVLSNTGGTVISSTGIIKMNLPPAIIVAPKDITTCTLTDVKFTSAASSGLPVQYRWQQTIDGISWSNIPIVSTNIFEMNSGAAATEKRVRMIVANTCGSDTSLPANLTVIDCLIPNAFSPNGDNVNDNWQINLPGAFTVQIYNRYGAAVYKAVHHAQFSWNGTTHNRPLPVGVYYYVITVPGLHTFKGTITLLR